MLLVYNHNIWNHNPTECRNTYVRELIEECDADVCTFQECGPHSSREGNAPIWKLMSDKYTEASIKTAPTSYTTLFFKTERFDLVEDGFLLYDGLNDSNSKSITWALLKEKESGKQFIIMSTHFWWMFEGQKDNQQRLQNVEQLQTLCDELIEKYNLPIIIGGDFNNGKNSLQGEEPYHTMLKKGFNDIRFSASISTDAHTCCDENYPVLLEDGETYVKYEKPADITIDYIFTYGENQPKALEFDVLVSDKACASSDHRPLIGCFEF